MEWSKEQKRVEDPKASEVDSKLVPELSTTKNRVSTTTSNSANQLPSTKCNSASGSKSSKPNNKLSKHLVKNNFYASTKDINRALVAQHDLILHIFQENFTIDNEPTRELPLQVRQLLKDYEEIFPDDLPQGLPPLRGIEHQIDLIPGAVIPNWPAYRANPEETREL